MPQPNNNASLKLNKKEKGGECHAISGGKIMILSMITGPVSKWN